MRKGGAWKMVNVVLWSGTVAIDNLFSFEHAVFLSKKMYFHVISVQYIK
jgi:hypothetical protein